MDQKTPIEILMGKKLSSMEDAEIERNLQRVQSLRATPVKLKELMEDVDEEGVEPMKFVRPRRKTKVEQALEDLLA